VAVLAGVLPLARFPMSPTCEGSGCRRLRPASVGGIGEVWRYTEVQRCTEVQRGRGTRRYGGTQKYGGTGGTTEVQGDTPAVSPKLRRKAS